MKLVLGLPVRLRMNSLWSPVNTAFQPALGLWRYFAGISGSLKPLLRDRVWR
jgi:hypothetical protein